MKFYVICEIHFKDHSFLPNLNILANSQSRLNFKILQSARIPVPWKCSIGFYADWACPGSSVILIFVQLFLP